MAKTKALECGLIMPISAIDGCSADHWSEVRSILTSSIESIEDEKFVVKLVSDADDVGIIQKRIVQNIYSSDIVVCDVSAKNPNVMFELGMRLAFDKPTIIVKDDATEYSFDTGIIEHLTYPRDLRFSKIVAFKEKLAEKVAATYSKSKEDPDHSTFLKNFGKFQVVNLNEDVVPADRMVLEMISDLQREFSSLRRHLINSKMESNVEVPRPPLSFSILLAIKSWAKENKYKLCDIEANDDLYNYIEHRIDASRRFKSRSDFISMVDEQLNNLNSLGKNTILSLGF